MKKTRILPLLLIISLLLTCISACGAPEEVTVPSETSGPKELWIVADDTYSTYSYLFELPLEQFQEEHKDITVNLEIIPTDEAKRETYLQQLRVQIMAGNGPDIYLSPCFARCFRT